ncbi:MAG: bifunctional DNA primase/polymerase [Candidatus Aquicultor sp.]
MNNETLDYARFYHEAGLTVLPLAEGAKKPPRGFSWSSLREKPQRADDLPALFSRTGANIGLMAGAISRDLVVLDVDSREKWQELDKSSVFRKLKAASPVVRTRRGFHVYLYAPYPCASGEAKRWNTDILAEGKYAVAPPSEVRREKGGAVQLYLFSNGYMMPIYPPSSDEWADLVDVFGIRPVAPSDDDIILTPGAASGLFYGLGDRAWNALRKPESRGDRSEREQRAVFRAVSMGWGFDDTSALFSQHAAPGTKYREKERAGYGEEWLKNGYRSALRKYAEIATPRARRLNQALDYLAMNTPFQGIGRYTDAAVLRWILHIERIADTDRVSLSIRNIAEGVGKGFATVREALERLREAGALTVISSNAGGLILTVPEAFIESALLAVPINIDTLEALRGENDEACPESPLLAEPINIDTLSYLRDGEDGSTLQDRKASSPPGGHAGFTIVPASHNAYRREALGSTGPHLVNALNGFNCQSFTVSSLMDKRFSFRYIRKALSLLLKANVIEPAGTKKAKHGKPVKLYTCPHALSFSALEAIAKAAGTDGAGERQRERYKKDREAMKQWKEREGRLY